jgi:rhodanese-related sulfurtransferase
VFKKLLVLLALALGLVVSVTACSASTSPAADYSQTVVIDVRTPAEYAAGHLEGAVNIDVEGPGFAAAVSELDPAGTYAVYCRSGRRSAVAADQMDRAGIVDVTDLGSLEAAADATGRPVTS